MMHAKAMFVEKSLDLFCNRDVSPGNILAAFDRSTTTSAEESESAHYTRPERVL